LLINRERLYSKVINCLTKFANIGADYRLGVGAEVNKSFLRSGRVSVIAVAVKVLESLMHIKSSSTHTDYSNKRLLN
jgi:hypothetical protein